MAQRRRIFDTHYGTAKTETGKGGPTLPPPMTKAPVPLAISGQEQGSLPVPGTDEELPLDMNQLLQQLLAQFGGANG